MTQEETNRAEWENPQNWSDSIVGLYFSKRDNRVWVPKRKPGLGWTLNLAHPQGAWLFLGLALTPVIATALLSRWGEK